ncbi:hypothetical protein V1478_015239 [Vespula squamosa]|uniref:Uncharacterized protein n=1 Tax=Vespula squamosa TaxID=30214 RepID=A0ABD2A4K4_VESSQ
MSTRGGIRLTVIRVRLIDGEACLSLNENIRETNSFRFVRAEGSSTVKDKILGKKNDIAKKYNKKDLFTLVDKKKKRKEKKYCLR